MLNNTAIVLASGSGVRFGGKVPKQFLPLLDKPVFLYSVETLARHPGIQKVVVVCHPDWNEGCRQWMAHLQTPWTVVPGGDTRMESGWNGLQAAGSDTQLVLIHDAARPLLRPALISELLEAAHLHGAVVPAVPCADTLIETHEQHVAAIPERVRIRRVQTPQAFRYSLLLEAFRRARHDGVQNPTDDAGLVYRLGLPVVWIPGDEENIKITTQADFLAAETLLRSRG
jgi:2-C-methyl-D-erythritol 4-phosphate cytidylyltransferase